MYNSKDKTLKDAFSNLSHDIRTPLTSLKGYFDLVCSENDENKRMKFESVINERIDTLSELLEELFTYTKLSDSQHNITSKI